MLEIYLRAIFSIAPIFAAACCVAWLADALLNAHREMHYGKYLRHEFGITFILMVMLLIVMLKAIASQTWGTLLWK